MAPPEMKRGRGDVPKHRSASRVSKQDRFKKANSLAKSKPRLSQGESSKATSSRSRAFDDHRYVQTQPLQRRHKEARSAAAHLALTLDGSSDPTHSGKSKSDPKAEASDHDTSPLGSDPDTKPPPNLNNIPAEIQQMIWGEVINTPACHTFKVKMGDVAEEKSRWTVHLWPRSSREETDPSAYQWWKRLLSLENISFQLAFRHFVKQLQPIALRLPKTNNAEYKADNFYKTMAAIDKEQDLVILELNRRHPLAWFEHANRNPSQGMNAALIQERMSHFRRVAIHYKAGQADCSMGGAFECLCHGGNQPHDWYKACPLTLASFLDLFPNLEHFFFVVEPKRVAEKKFAAVYREKVARTKFRAQIDHPGGAEATGKQFTLPHFFDQTSEYLQQAPGHYLQAWDMKSPWVGEDSAAECLIETRQFYKSQKGNEVFRQALEKRVKVRFGILIPYPLEDKKNDVSPSGSKKGQAAR